MTMKQKESLMRLIRSIVIGFIAYTILFIDLNHRHQFSTQEYNLLSISSIGLIIILFIDITNELNS